MKQFIPSKTLNTCLSDPKWWTPECSTAVLGKDRAWKKWPQDVRNYTLKTIFLDSITAASQLYLAQSAWDRRIKSKLSTGNLGDKTWWKPSKPQQGKSDPQIFPRWSRVDRRQIIWLSTFLPTVVLGTTTSGSTIYRTRCSCLLRALHSVVFISVFTQSSGTYLAWMPLKLPVQKESLHGY